MTDREWEWWSCKRKHGFSRGEAKAKISLAERKYRTRYYRYKCEFCGLYHLTKNWLPEK